MNTDIKIDEVIDIVRENCPNVFIAKLTGFGEKSLEQGVWKFWIEGEEDFQLFIEVQYGLCYAISSNKPVESKYPITGAKICGFFRQFQDSKL